MISVWGVNHGEVIAKTRLPNGSWVKASSLTKTELRAANKGRKAGELKRKTDDDAKFREYANSQRDMKKMLDDIRDGKTPDWTNKQGMVFTTPNKQAEREMQQANMSAFATSFGGRKGKKVMVVPKGSEPETVDHEIAHLTPKRSSYRLHQVISDPKRIPREEARAEMSANHRGGYWRNKDTEPSSGYGAAARSPFKRQMYRAVEEMQGLSGGFDKKIFTQEGMKLYRSTQDQIHRANPNRLPPMGTKGYSNPKFRGNQHVDEKGQKKGNARRNLTLLGGGTAAGGYGVYRYNKGKKK